MRIDNIVQWNLRTMKIILLYQIFHYTCINRVAQKERNTYD